MTNLAFTLGFFFILIPRGIVWCFQRREQRSTYNLRY
jgi:hypothetical protein